MITSYKKTRRRSLPIDQVSKIATTLAQYLRTTDMYIPILINRSIGYSTEAQQAYKQLFARIHQLRNEEHRTLEDVFVESTANAIVRITIRKLQELV